MVRFTKKKKHTFTVSKNKKRGIQPIRKRTKSKRNKQTKKQLGGVGKHNRSIKKNHRATKIKKKNQRGGNSVLTVVDGVDKITDAEIAKLSEDCECFGIKPIKQENGMKKLKEAGFYNRGNKMFLLKHEDKIVSFAEWHADNSIWNICKTIDGKKYKNTRKKLLCLIGEYLEKETSLLKEDITENTYNITIEPKQVISAYFAPVINIKSDSERVGIQITDYHDSTDPIKKQLEEKNVTPTGLWIKHIYTQPDDDTSPEIGPELLNEKYEVLKTKLQELSKEKKSVLVLTNKNNIEHNEKTVVLAKTTDNDAREFFASCGFLKMGDEEKLIDGDKHIYMQKDNSNVKSDDVNIELTEPVTSVAPVAPITESDDTPQEQKRPDRAPPPIPDEAQKAKDEEEHKEEAQKAKDEEEHKAQEAQAEAERKAQEAQAEEERKAQAALAEKEAQAEEERKAQAALAEKEAKDEEERKAQAALAEKEAKDEEERKAQVALAEKEAQAEAERKAQVALAEKEAQAEAERKAEAETERKAKEAQEAQAEAERRKIQAREERKTQAEKIVQKRRQVIIILDELSRLVKKDATTIVKMNKKRMAINASENITELDKFRKQIEEKIKEANQINQINQMGGSLEFFW
jgi:hypothetical protein